MSEMAASASEGADATSKVQEEDPSVVAAQVEAQRKAIAAEMQAKPMVGEIESPSALLSEYEGASNAGFVPGIEFLSKKFKGMRRVRGDGNCFYRAFLFSYLEQLLTKLTSGAAEAEAEAREELVRMTNVLNDSRRQLVELGYEEMTFEDFLNMLLELVQELPTGVTTRESLLAAFQEEGGNADYYTWYMRLLTAGSMKRDEARYAAFIDDGSSLHQYCLREVEPMGKECEQLQIVALTEFLRVKVSIQYLDGRSFDAATGLDVHVFPSASDEAGGAEGGAGAVASSTPTVHLLYRPGHYDVLYL